jgi:digalactosyldiacylglycerol synthase
MTLKIYSSWGILVALIAISGINFCVGKDLGDSDDASSSKQGAAVQESSSSFKFRTEAARKRWKSTFEEIQKIVLETPKPKKASFYDQWKLFLDTGVEVRKEQNLSQTINGTTIGGERDKNSTVIAYEKELRKRQRFDGFSSWEKILQEWADETAEVLAINQKQFDKIMHLDDEKLVTTDDEDEQPKAAQFQPRPAKANEAILPHTDIGDKSKKLWIVTTAALPWMTGTAVNPLLRAAYLTQGRSEVGGKVTLMLPWLERVADRDKIYGRERPFDTSEEQELFIRNWLKDKANMKEASEALNIQWYTGRHETQENSIYSMGDLISLIPEEDVDICILEEPEHLNWYRAPGESWTKKFKHVVGIVHTNYFVYAQDQPAALVRAPGMRLLCSWMCRAHCHRIIKLSGTLQKFAPEKELVENVHGVRDTFLDYGKNMSTLLKSSDVITHPVFGPDSKPKVYFIGKMLWSKGIGSLMDLLQYAKESADLEIDFDMYGGGPDLEDAMKKSKNLGLNMTFHGPIDHAALASTHKIFVNPSLSEVLCTTVAEALAMGKFVIVPSHPSNDFFAQFSNCLTYANKEEFVGNLYYAMTHSPEPLSKESSYALSWDAANERLAAAGCITEAESKEFQEYVKSSNVAAIEIGLPPLIEDEERRKKISKTVKSTRARFRDFRSKLAQEIAQSRVLPLELQEKMLGELDKRLDLDVDELLGSPKLKIQLSPAELDRQLLDLYNTISENPGADIFRTVMGGANVGRQNMYIREQMRKESKARALQERRSGNTVIPQFLDDVGGGDTRSATKWVKKALRRNMQSSGNHSLIPESKLSSSKQSSSSPYFADESKTTMRLSLTNSRKRITQLNVKYPNTAFRTPTHFSSRIPSLLI